MCVQLQDKEGQLFTSWVFAGCFYLVKCTGNWTQLNLIVLTTLTKINSKLSGLGKVHWCTGVPRCHHVSLYTVSCQSAKCKLDSTQPVNCLGGVIAAILAIWIEEVSGLSQKSILRVVCSWQSELQTGHHGVARY